MTTFRFRRPTRSGGEKQRGAALVEFAIAVPIFLVLIALIFDTGLGFAASRSSSSAARSAARIGALAGEDRSADFRILDAVRATYGNGEGVAQITVYVSDPDGDGSVPAGCEYSFAPDGTEGPETVDDGVLGTSQEGECNVYAGSILETLGTENFGAEGETTCDGGAIDSAWCPATRRNEEGQYLGVAIWTLHDPTVGIVPGTDTFNLTDRAVFAMYFPPLPVTPTPG